MKKFLLGASCLCITLSVSGCLNLDKAPKKTIEQIYKYQNSDPLSQWVSKNVPPDRVDTIIEDTLKRLKKDTKEAIEKNREEVVINVKKLESILNKILIYNKNVEQHLSPEELEIFAPCNTILEVVFKKIKVHLLPHARYHGFDGFLRSYLSAYVEIAKEQLKIS